MTVVPEVQDLLNSYMPMPDSMQTYNGTDFWFSVKNPRMYIHAVIILAAVLQKKNLDLAFV
jgi:hypothetical protein